MLTLVGYIGYINNPKGTDHGRLGAEICELISCHGRFIENPSRKQALLWLADLCVNRDGDYIGYQKRYESIKERYKNDPERLFQVYRILEYLQIHFSEYR